MTRRLPRSSDMFQDLAPRQLDAIRGGKDKKKAPAPPLGTIVGGPLIGTNIGSQVGGASPEGESS